MDRSLAVGYNGCKEWPKRATRILDELASERRGPAMPDHPSVPIEPLVGRWRRQLRFSLRSVMVLILILGGGLGWFIHRAHIQQDAVAAIRQAGGSVIYEWQWKDGSFDPSGKPRVPGRLLDRLGPDLIYRVKRVDIGQGRADDSLMSPVGRLDGLEVLNLSGCRGVTDAGLAHLSDLTALRDLNVSGTGASGAGLKHLAALTRLERLEAPWGPTRDSDLASLKGLTALRWLQFQAASPDVTDAGLAHLSGLVNLETLSICSARITSAGLASLHGLSKLQTLNVRRSGVTDLAPIPAPDPIDVVKSFVEPDR